MEGGALSAYSVLERCFEERALYRAGAMKWEGEECTPTVQRILLKRYDEEDVFFITPPHSASMVLPFYIVQCKIIASLYQYAYHARFYITSMVGKQTEWEAVAPLCDAYHHTPYRRSLRTARWFSLCKHQLTEELRKVDAVVFRFWEEAERTYRVSYRNKAHRSKWSTLQEFKRIQTIKNQQRHHMKQVASDITEEVAYRWPIMCYSGVGNRIKNQWKHHPEFSTMFVAH